MFYSTVQALLQNLCVNQVHVKKEDESSGSEEDGLMESKKRKFESERGQEELQNICKIQRMQRNRESAAYRDYGRESTQNNLNQR